MIANCKLKGRERRMSFRHLIDRNEHLLVYCLSFIRSDHHHSLYLFVCLCELCLRQLYALNGCIFILAHFADCPSCTCCRTCIEQSISKKRRHLEIEEGALIHQRQHDLSDTWGREREKEDELGELVLPVLPNLVHFQDDWCSCHRLPHSTYYLSSTIPS